ncbi:hypothetical protein QQL38_23965 [Pseudomonas syringae]|jgi:DNA-directed RNA polymerase subunit RPC12/RpoP|uniref:hypothetical protein n=1 Tax=Pseudomonas syringae TaxID=317 RepID=UPI0011AEEF42|nr:hypothetical protein [Pseudomonas syringae]MBS7433903.1 hypothetical protein [Pseudomonas syringae]MCL6308937.1 hypothetical protein [Pseudomonas syringae]QVI80018.1 hypothetical protein KHW15_24145 [Pseudomonas syringae]
MNDIYICTKCPTVFEAIHHSGGFPGGKDREYINCPNCGHAAGSEVTSGLINTREITGERKSQILAKQR